MDPEEFSAMIGAAYHEVARMTATEIADELDRRADRDARPVRAGAFQDAADIARTYARHLAVRTA